QAEDGIRDLIVTGVQTCALPIYLLEPEKAFSFDARALDASAIAKCTSIVDASSARASKLNAFSGSSRLSVLPPSFSCAAAGVQSSNTTRVEKSRFTSWFPRPPTAGRRAGRARLGPR